jgi:hypothetical protein
MRTAILVLSLLLLAACETDKQSAAPAPGGSGQEAQAPPADGQAAGAKGRSPFVHCIDLIRERRFTEALPVCRDAEKSNPNDPQIQRAIQLAESGGSEEE